MCNKTLHIGKIKINWLGGGNFRLDGGTMFGPVPKILWQKKLAADSNNCILFCNDPILVQTGTSNIIIDTGLGNKLTPKQKDIFQVDKAWNLPAQLHELRLSRDEIDTVILTHCDFDHAGGIVMHNEQGEEELTFPKATHIIQEKEWQDVENPCRRSQSTYWPENFNKLKEAGEIKLVCDEEDICPGIRVIHSGGHTRGHQIVEISSAGETAVHLGDLLPSQAHTNPLWVMAYDNFPLEVIDLKEEYFQKYTTKGAWFLLYHDPFLRACKLDGQGNIIERH